MTKNKTPKASKKSASTTTEPAKKQQSLDAPGMERKRIPEIEDAANELRGTRTEHMGLQKLEAEQQETLVSVMRAHGVKLYKFDGDEDELVVELDDVTKMKVRKATTVKAEDE